MQPPPRGRGPDAPPPPGGPGAAGDDDPIVARIRAWARHPTAEDTLTLCDELRRTPTVRGQHVDAFGRAIVQRHGKDGRVLLALGRLQLAIGKLSDAQQTLVNAGRADPNARGPYRYLGEVLLRRGDAARAERMLEKAVEIESRSGDHGDLSEDPSTEWLMRARSLRKTQEAQGEGAVAAEMAAILAKKRPTGSPRGSLRAPEPVHADSDDEPTQAGQIPEDLRKRATPGFQTNIGGDANAKLPPVSPALKPQSTQSRIEQSAALKPLPTPPTMNMQAPQVPPGALRPNPTPPGLRPQRTPPPLPALKPNPTPPALKPRATPPPIPQPMFPPPPPRAPQIHELPRFDDSIKTQVSIDEDSGAALVTTGDFLGTDHPTIQSSREHESMPKLPIVPPRDNAPEPEIGGTNTGRLRALKAQSVTLGEPAADERLSTRPLRPTPAPGGDGNWNTERVLGALERAGIYEKDAAAASPAQWMKRREIQRPRRRGGWLYAILAIVVIGGIGGAVFGGKAYKEKQRAQAEQATLRAEADVRKSNLDSLANAEKDLGQAFELDSRTLRGARVWLQDRVLRSYVWPSEARKEGGLASAIERAKTVGVPEPELAFARIALALSSDDTPSAAALAKTLDPGAAKDKLDAWRELAVGWVLERAGDARAADRYSHAVQLDPELVAARLALSKLAALAGDRDRVDSLTKDFAGELTATRLDLLALASFIRDGKSEQPGPPDPRRPAGFGWIGPALIVADPKVDLETRKKEAGRATALARDPGDLTRIGRFAAAAGDEATASRAALRALEASPIFPPARALGARLALSVGRPDDAARALDGVVAEGDPELAALRAWLAYERGDLGGVQHALDDPTVAGGALDRADIASIVKPLRFALAKRSATSLNNKDKTELEAIAALGELGPLVAFDVAIGALELQAAEGIAKKWTEDASQRPARALRLARLARLQGRAEDADKMSKIAVEQATVTPAALIERVLVLGNVGKGADALALLTRYPLLAADEQPWLRAWATAQAGKMADAKKQVEALKEPDRKAPWAVRRDALLALSATNDKRAKAYAKDLAKERANDPDVRAIGRALGVLKE
jgi:hypothetical protein